MRLPLRPGRLIAVTARRPVQPGRTRFAAAGMWSTRHVDAQEATVQGAPHALRHAIRSGVSRWFRERHHLISPSPARDV